MKYWVEAMEARMVHVDAVNGFGNTFGVVSVCETGGFELEYWLRYWALKPHVQTFWTKITRDYELTREDSVRFQAVILSRMADIPALWEDLPFLYNLVAENGHRLAWLLPELHRRVPASLRFAWIAAVSQ
jgi:hypothetical protein